MTALAQLFDTAMWDRHLTYLAAPRRVLQAHDTTCLVVADAAINVLRRGSDGRWRYTISLLDNNDKTERAESMTIAAASRQVLDFNPVVGMVVDGAPPKDPETDPWRVTMICFETEWWLPIPIPIPIEN